MSTVAITTTTTQTTTTQTAAAPAGATRPSVQFWGMLLVTPYVLVFLIFVLYPV